MTRDTYMVPTKEEKGDLVSSSTTPETKPTNDLGEEDLYLIETALGAYLAGLQPSIGYVKEIRSWHNRVSEVRTKVSALMLKQRVG